MVTSERRRPTITSHPLAPSGLADARSSSSSPPCGFRFVVAGAGSEAYQSSGSDTRKQQHHENEAPEEATWGDQKECRESRTYRSSTAR